MTKCFISRPVQVWLCISLATAVLMMAPSKSIAQDTAGRASGVDLATLPRLVAERYPEVRSLVLARHGCLELEYYRTGQSAESRSTVRSITKSVLSILVGIAIDQGYLRLDERLSEVLPEALDPMVDVRVRDITIRDLLTMSSGYSTAPFGARPASPPRETWKWTLNRAVEYAPGTRFNYDDDSVNLLAVVLTRAIRQNVRAFAEEKLFRPLEITGFDWNADSEGYLIGADGLSLTAKDMIKLGQLYLLRGRWADKQLVSSSYVLDSTAKHNNGGPPVRAAAYGYLWWLKQTETGLDAFFASGKGGQLIYIVPKLDLVVALVSSSDISGGSVHFANNIVLPAANLTVSPRTCGARLGTTYSDFR
jgi:CubicO group peptidase (beta-lactamase class C family)